MKKLIISAFLLISTSLVAQNQSGKEFIGFGLMPFAQQAAYLKSNKWEYQKVDNRIEGQYSIDEYYFMKSENNTNFALSLQVMVDNNSGAKCYITKIGTPSKEVYNKLVSGFINQGYIFKSEDGKQISDQKRFSLAYWIEMYKNQKLYYVKIASL
jgi:hypothetical protein